MNTREQQQALSEWAKRIENITSLRAQDIIHDIAGIMRDDKHFLPRL
tara:strand:- start:107 stop:247 length:141 start_codon:yes stop_codon:yes gene_type:complete